LISNKITLRSYGYSFEFTFYFILKILVSLAMSKTAEFCQEF
jgi:hypothetical protein